MCEVCMCRVLYFLKYYTSTSGLTSDLWLLWSVKTCLWMEEQSDSLTAHLNWPDFLERSQQLVRIFNNIQQLYVYVASAPHLSCFLLRCSFILTSCSKKNILGIKINPMHHFLVADCLPKVPKIFNDRPSEYNQINVCVPPHTGKKPAGVIEGAEWGDEQNAIVYHLSAVCEPAEERKVE